MESLVKRNKYNPSQIARQRQLLKAIVEQFGFIRLACIQANVEPEELEEWVARKPVFRTQLKRAIRRAIEQTNEMTSTAVRGLLKKGHKAITQIFLQYYGEEAMQQLLAGEVIEFKEVPR